MDMDYGEQILAKSDRLRALFGREVEIIPSEQTQYFRNRMEYAFGDGVAGLHQNWHTLVDVHACLLLSPQSMPILRWIRDEVTRRGISDYDRRKLTGYFRYVVIREGKFTGQRLVVMVTSPEDHPALGEMAEHLQREFRVDGVAHATTGSVADLSRGPVRRVWGRKFIEEDLDGTLLSMGPNSFFQPNSQQARVLYRDIASHLPPYSRVLDLFCGVGSIGLYTGARVTGVDNDAENIELARENARRNGRRSEYILADAGRVELGGFDALIVDPPRIGLHPKLARRMNELGPDLLIYVSCNPDALVRDLRILRSYSIRTLRSYDFCPHTPHIETLCVLSRA